jgi:dolichol-phosphate mannosyltransferase
MPNKIACVIIPTYNEAGNIERTVNQLQQVFKQIKDWQMHILVVDDTSPDKTYDKVKILQKEFPNLHLLVNKTKNGLGAAYLKGMDHAFDKLKADIVFEFDADLSHDPKKIPLFLEKIEQGYGLVIGSRYIPGGSIPKDWGLHRKFLSKVGNLVIRVILTNFTVSDWTTGFRAVTKDTYQKINPEMRDQRFSGYTFQIGFLYKAVQKKVKIAEVPFHFIDRTIGKSKIGPEYIVNNLIYLGKTRLLDFMQTRVFKFLVVGSIAASLQLVLLEVWRLVFSYQIANAFAIECAIIFNFIMNNFWTFGDRKLKLKQVPLKFVQFNLTSAGSILIQLLIAFLGETFIGIQDVMVLPVINYLLDTGPIFSALGIIIGMFWNFFAYNFFIWKKKK